MHPDHSAAIALHWRLPAPWFPFFPEKMIPSGAFYSVSRDRVGSMGTSIVERGRVFKIQRLGPDPAGCQIFRAGPNRLADVAGARVRIAFVVDVTEQECIS